MKLLHACPLRASRLPTVWKMDIKPPFLKPGKQRDEMGHLRHITFTCDAGKQQESLISAIHALRDDLEQGAFIRGKSTDGRVL